MRSKNELADKFVACLYRIVNFSDDEKEEFVADVARFIEEWRKRRKQADERSS